MKDIKLQDVELAYISPLLSLAKLLLTLLLEESIELFNFCCHAALCLFQLTGILGF